MSLLLKATHFAAEKHSAQRRKNKAASPYINHPIEVAEHLHRVGGVTDETILVAALLHDTIEDTQTNEDEIREAFGDEVLALVLECTDDKNLEKMERKRLQIVNAPKKSSGAKQIKIADKTCNLRSILDDPPEGWPIARQLEYFKWATDVVAGLKGVNSRLDEEVDKVIHAGTSLLTKAEQ
jgi:guanosine-3',5'-bis(diphosphate) 3'-pyrophosphohydrolase